MSDSELDSVSGDEEGKVFLSYSRKDRERAQRIADVLRERHFGVFKDTDDILPTEEWKGRLEQLIAEADTIVFLLSSNSVASEVCAWEVEYATALNKRIAPIVIEEVDTATIPALLARLNFIFCTERDRFQDAVESLVSALGTDIEWIREHTRLGGLAARWEKAGRPARLLLRGQDISDAEQWRDTRPGDAPEVTQPQARFINESRRAAARRQRLTVAFSLAGMIVALGLAGFAYIQREAAVENEKRATAAQSLAEQQRDEAQTNQSLLLARFAETELRAVRPVEAALLSLEGLPDRASSDPARRGRPLVDQAQVMLRRAVRQIHERKIVARMRAAIDEADVHKKAGLAVLRASQTGETVVVDLSSLSQRYALDAANFKGQRDRFVFSPDGAQLAALTAKGRLVVLDSRTGAEKANIDPGKGATGVVGFARSGTHILIRRSSEGVVAVDLEPAQARFAIDGETFALSADGAWLGVVRAEKLALYDAETGALVQQSERSLKGPLNTANRLVFSPGGTWLAAASDHYTWVFDGKTGAYVGNTGQRKQSQLALGFSPDDDWLYVGGADGRTILYDLRKKSVVARYDGQRSWVFDVDISEDKQRLLSTGSTGEWQLWEPGGKKPIVRGRGHLKAVTKGFFIRGDKMVLTVSEDGTARVWTLPHRQQPGKTLVEEFRGAPVYSPDRRRVALSGAGLFVVETGKAAIRAPASSLGPLYVKFSKSGDRLLGVSRNPQTGRDDGICLYDGHTGAEIRCPVRNPGIKVWRADMDDAAKLIAAHVVIDQVSMIVTYDGKTGEELARLPFKMFTRAKKRDGDYSEPAVSPDGRRIYVRQFDNELVVFDRTLKKQTDAPIRIAKGGPQALLVLHQLGHAVFYWPNGAVEVVDLKSGRSTAQYTLAKQAYSTLYPSPSGRYLVATHKATGMILADTMSGKTVLRMTHPGREEMQYPIFSADERYVMASRDATTIVWDIETGRKLETLTMDFGGAYPSVYVKGFSPDMSRIVTWSWSGLKHWDFHPDAYALITATQTGIARCLSRAQRKAFFLSPEPPRWCITGPGAQKEPDPEKWQPKYPYQGKKWRDWQQARDRAATPALP